jgi:hypothetical protein
MKLLHLTRFATIGLLAMSASLSYASDLSSEDKQFLVGYEKVRSALAADDLDGAKQAAAELGAQGAALSSSDKLSAVRSEFEKLSSRAIELGRGQDGYYVVNCPMLKKDWLQTSTKISNPYAGKSMPDCGVIKK